MAFKNGLSERLDELRFPSPRSPPADAHFNAYTPLSPQSNLISAFQRPSTEVRANLQRRFTTDASKLSSWTFANQQSSQTSESLDLLSSGLAPIVPFEKKRQHIEYMREQKKRFEADMKLLDLQHEREKQEMDQLARDLANAGLSGPVSEPTTPPEYRDTTFSSAFPRHTRFSTSSVTSSPGIFNIFSPSSVTSPPTTSHTNRNGTTPTANNQRFSVQSVPGSRRNSEEEEYFPDSTSAYRPGPSIHRYSMPTTSLAAQLRSTTATYNNSTLEPFNAAKLLFGDESRGAPKDEDRLPTPDIKSYLRMTDLDDKFPTLSQNSGLLSANSDALDLANSRTPEPWNTHSRYRSMPQGDLNMFRSENQIDGAPSTDMGNHTRHAARHSVELNFFGKQEPTTPTGPTSTRPVSLQSSYSTNDLPTMKANGFGNSITPPKSHAEAFHQHNASLGRIPPGAANSRSAKESPEREDSNLVANGNGPASGLQPTAAPFGPQLSAASGPTLTGPATGNGIPNFQGQFFPYAAQPYMNNGIPVNGSNVQNFNGQAPYPGFGQNGGFQFSRIPARQNNAPAHRNGETDAQQVSRFANLPLEQYRGELYGLCKDQHGCRYLQRKLEERNPDHVQMIFAETCMHVVELMTDPFGNYLCQKLLEYSNDDQRTRLIHNAAPQLVPIALNQHGTRALQKMIEFVSTQQQIQMVIEALRGHVVDLVQDLNGNHVIQKCLNRLSAEDAQFIYDAVGSSCVVVGTHRHGCCVLQRCIDHASGDQRARLIAQITSNAFSLVQDPFGNYVVQYILDLSEPHFTEPLCQTFLGNIPPLSKQKFSSNVIEKCLRTAELPMRRRMTEELLVPRELEAMLRDSFANYVVQTAMDFVDADTRNRLMDAIRPILPAIRQTPHGRRIAGKMAGVESSGRTSGNPSGQATPNDMSSGQLPASMQVPPKPFLNGPNSFGANGTAAQSPPALVLHGISATCKSTITRAVLEALNVPHTVVRCAECITGRHLLTKILLETLRVLDLGDEWERFGKGKCEYVSTLVVLLTDAFSSSKGKGVDKFILVLDGIDKQRDASQMLLAALARLGEVIPVLTVILVLNTTPRPLFLSLAGVPHISFPPYTRKEAITIITASNPPAVEGISDTTLKIYPQFVSTVYDSLVGPTVGTIPSFRSICERLWPRFVQPVLTETPLGGSGEWDFPKLLVRNRAMFKIQGETMLVHHIVSDEATTKNNSRSITFLAPKPPSLPYFPTLVLTSAYVASHTPSRLDTIFFSKFSSSSLSARNKRSHHRRRLKLLSQAQAEDDLDDPSTPRKGKRVKTKITKTMLDSAFVTTSATTSAGSGGGHLAGPSTILTARPFTLERLIAIYHAIDPNPPANPIRAPAMADTIYTELATLRRLRLVVPSGSANISGSSATTTTADAGEKWCVNISGDWIGDLAKGIGIEVGEWLAGGLD
ncbi:hypothetical protein BGW36DRAFT_400483 [Talaromyces proteolyticus]|uniref:PUM-HD domain-containing protein n=1 Tax=Talaromyces proteolyticus TaxID=1131652 RepID=A0AAD4PSF1_9EURO|nr:uncharacterized protein BGW36DRAFT_400483 [Talaromyces proteolyticus]KAH8691131.1 hypothetical protein BGW36DRAFT_400483 [Talaromyces proteolyticus]